MRSASARRPVAAVEAQGVASSRRRQGRAMTSRRKSERSARTAGASLRCKDAGARVLHDPAVGDAGGADGLAVAALQALVEVADGVRRRVDAAFGQRAHQVEAAARRLRLEAGLDVGGAGLQAEAAVDAAREVRVGRGVRAERVAPSELPHEAARAEDAVGVELLL